MLFISVEHHNFATDTTAIRGGAVWSQRKTQRTTWMALALAALGRFAPGALWPRPAAARPITPPRRAAAEAEHPGATRAVLLEMMHRETDRAQGELEVLILMAGSIQDP
jgi:hypothetical protein